MYLSLIRNVSVHALYGFYIVPFMLTESNQSSVSDSFLFIKLAQRDNYVQANTVRSGVDITGSVDVIIDTWYVTSRTVCEQR